MIKTTSARRFPTRPLPPSGKPALLSLSTLTSHHVYHCCARTDVDGRRVAIPRVKLFPAII